jgi:hypothetical protein
MKHLREYSTRYTPLGEMCTPEIGCFWAEVLVEMPDGVLLDKEEFYHFVRYFMDKLPHDWDRKSLMGIKLILVDA